MNIPSSEHGNIRKGRRDESRDENGRVESKNEVGIAAPYTQAARGSISARQITLSSESKSLNFSLAACLFNYGCVAFTLLTTGLLFTVFAIFQKDSQIGKVWLAGPVTMVVGLVLCGKVIIDWGPAMLHAREGSIDSRLVEQMANPIVNPMAGVNPPSEYKAPMTRADFENVLTEIRVENKRNGHVPSSRERVEGRISSDPTDCIIYAHYDPPLTNLNGLNRYSRMDGRDHHHPASSLPSSSSGASPSRGSRSSQVELCQCAKYGSIGSRRATQPVAPPLLPPPHSPYHGESFVLNERNYLI